MRPTRAYEGTMHTHMHTKVDRQGIRQATQGRRRQAQAHNVYPPKGRRAREEGDSPKAHNAYQPKGRQAREAGDRPKAHNVYQPNG